jgi:cytochrome c oxidase cbb3-type subunit III
MTEPTNESLAGTNQAPVQDQLLDHEYDGIQEYDNPTPGWWNMLFIGSIVFAVFYFIYFHSNVPDRGIHDAYEAARGADLQREFAKFGELKSDTQALLGYMAKPDYIAVGQAIFKQNCVSCHSSQGEGQVGPNLTDDYYKNVSVLQDIPKVIANGANNGAMPSWSMRGLQKNEIILVSAYVASLRGKNIPGAAPYGVTIPAWPKLEAQPETAPAGAPAVKP